MNSLPIEKEPTIIADLQALGRHMPEAPEKILYPCCGTDVSPSAAFPQARTTYVDMRREAIMSLAQEGFDAVYGRIPTDHPHDKAESDDNRVPLYVPPEDVDLLVLFNPQISPFAISEYVRHSGYLICNNYHQTADEIHKSCPHFALRGVIGEERGMVDTENLNEYFEYVDNNEEWRKRSPETYADALKFLYPLRSRLQGIFRNLRALPNYNAIIAKGKHGMYSMMKVGKRLAPLPPRKKWGKFLPVPVRAIKELHGNRTVLPSH